MAGFNPGAVTLPVIPNTNTSGNSAFTGVGTPTSSILSPSATAFASNVQPGLTFPHPVTGVQTPVVPAASQSSIQTTTLPSGGTVDSINGGQAYSNPLDNPAYVAAHTYVPPKTFSSQIPTGGATIPSSYLAPTSQQALLTQYEQKYGAMQSGTNPDGSPINSTANMLAASGSLQGQIASGLYTSSLYSPAQQQMISQNADLTAQINNIKLAQTAQAQHLFSNGQLSSQDALNFYNDVNNKAGATLGNLQAQQGILAASMTAAGLNQQNQIAAYQGVGNLINAGQTSVAPGSTVYNPYTPGATYQGAGASPAQILSQAQTLYSNDQATGTTHYASNGQPDWNYYQALASQQFSNPNGNSQAQGLNSSSTGQTAGTTQPQAIVGNAVASAQNIKQQSYAYALNAGATPVTAQAVDQTPFSTDYYIDGTQTGNLSQAQINADSAKTGISYVPSQFVPNVKSLDTALAQQANLASLANQYLTPGLLGRLKGLTTNQINSYLELDPGWAKFNAVRLSAIDYLKGLAQGGGFRTNQSEIDTAENALTDITDNLGSAQAKITTAVTNLDTAFKQYLPTHKDTNIQQLLSGQLAAPSYQARTSSSSSNPFDISNFNIQ